MKISRFILAFVVLVFAVTVWRLVDFNLSRQQPSSDVPLIAATTMPLADIIRNVAGDAVIVEQLIPTGTDPHTFEPTPSLAETVMNADVVYAIAYGYDNWVTDLADGNTDIVNLAGDITKRREELSNGVSYTDPHYWLSIANAQSMARLVARDLSSRFPEHRATFQTNAATYLAALAETEVAIRAQLSALEQKNIVTQHDAWYYFANDYGLTQLAQFEETAEEEPSARHLADLGATMRAAGLSTIYAHAGETSETLTQFAEDNGFTLLTVDPEGLGTATSFIDLMLANAQAFSQNR